MHILFQFVVMDTDKRSQGRICYSNNDPHMRTFDGKYVVLFITYVLQIEQYNWKEKNITLSEQFRKPKPL